MTLKENGVEITGLLSNCLNHPAWEMQEFFAWSLMDTIFLNK